MTNCDRNTDNNVFQTSNGHRRSAVYVFRELIEQMSDLQDHFGRPPSSDEIAAALGMGIDAYLSLLEEVYLFYRVYAECPLGEKKTVQRHIHLLLRDHVVSITSTSSCRQRSGANKMEVLANAIEGLPEQERLIITLHFFEELNLKEIAYILGLSETVCAQVFVQAVLRLSSNFKMYGKSK